MSNARLDPRDVEFGKTVRARREQLGVGVTELAKKIGVSRTHVYNVEKGHPISGDLRAKIIRELSLNKQDVEGVNGVVVRAAAFRAKVEKGELLTSLDIEIGEDIRRELDKKSRPTAYHMHLNVLARAYRQRREHHNTIKYAEEARTHFLSVDNYVESCRSAFEIATVEFEDARYQVAVTRYERIVRDYALYSLDEDEVYRQSCVIAAVCYACLDQVVEMNEYLEMVADIEQVDSPVGLWRSATIDYLTAESLLQDKQYGLALGRYETAYQKFKARNDEANALRVEHTIAWCLFKAGEYEKAREQALRVRERAVDDAPNHARATNLLAEIALATHKHDDAFTWAEKVYVDRRVPKQLRAHALHWAAQALYQMGRIEDYVRHTEQALKFAANEDSALFEKLTVELLTRNPLRGMPDLD